MKGFFIAIEGTDGSGKKTQAELLRMRLEHDGYTVVPASFPQYGKKSAGPVEEYLNGKYPELFDENSKRVTKALSKTRGVLWGIDEKAYAIGLSSKGDSFVVVAEKVNSRFHNGIPVRNSGSVRNIILRIKKKKKRT